MIIRINLKPISVNKLFAGMSRRYKTQEYKDWQAEFILKFKENLPKLVPSKNEEIKAIIEWHSDDFYTKNKGIKRKDLDNISKAILDVLDICFNQYGSDGYDDSQIFDLHLKKVADTENYLIIKYNKRGAKKQT